MSAERLKIYSPVVQQKSEQLADLIKFTGTAEDLLSIAEKKYVMVEPKYQPDTAVRTALRVDGQALGGLQKVIRALVDDIIDLGHPEIACQFYALYKNRDKISGKKPTSAEEEKFNKIIGEMDK